MAAVVRITTPTATPTLRTSGAALPLAGTSNNIVFADPQNVDVDGASGSFIPLFTLHNQSDGITPDLAVALDPSRWTIKTETGRYIGTAITWLAFDELRIDVAIDDPDDQASPPLTTYDGSRVEPFTALGASLASFADHPGGGSDPVLTYRGEIVNGLGTTPFNVSGAAPQGTWQSDEPVPLQMGENIITIYAEDADENEVSDTLTVTRVNRAALFIALDLL